MLYTITLPNGLRTGIVLSEVMAVEEVLSEEPVPGGVSKKRLLRLFLRNGASFTVDDADRDRFDRLMALYKFGDHENPYNEGESDASS